MENGHNLFIKSPIVIKKSLYCNEINVLFILNYGHDPNHSRRSLHCNESLREQTPSHSLINYNIQCHELVSDLLK